MNEPAPAGSSSILLARHGETNDNREPIRVQGFTDTPLNDTGRRQAAELAERVQMQAGRVDQLVSTLSGGNQQKVVLGKWLAAGPRLLILDEPTHGIDVGTKAEVLRIVAELARSGVAVVLISSELDEVRSMSTRLLVMRAGRLVGEFDCPVDSDTVMHAAAGVSGGVS
jgi:rhamnose transport system ATP-binding protein